MSRHDRVQESVGVRAATPSIDRKEQVSPDAGGRAVGCCTDDYVVPATGRACCESAERTPAEPTAIRELPASDDEVRAQVRSFYAERAVTATSCCGGDCGCATDSTRISTSLGYSAEELAEAPVDADLGLGCGNPTAIDTISEGEIVLDLGSGAGIDCFLAARKVGPTGRVIGVDMTPEMLDRARENARKIGAANVEFRLGEIEHLPVADASVDVVISNCVINLSTDKPRVFKEALRVLKPGGRLMVSDLVLTRELPDFIRSSAEAYAACIAGAMPRDQYLAQIRDAGFADVRVTAEVDYLAAVGAELIGEWAPVERREEAMVFLDGGTAVASVSIWATKA